MKWLQIAALALLTTALTCGIANAQASRQQQNQQQGTGNPKPVGQYIVLVMLLAIPFGLVCRSSRRM